MLWAGGSRYDLGDNAGASEYSGSSFLIGLSAVIVAGDAPIEEDTLKKAEQNDVLILATSLPAYDVIGKLMNLVSGM